MRIAFIMPTIFVALWWPSAATPQWLGVPRSEMPRTSDGQVNLKAPAPRLTDGTSDLTGIWRSTDNKYLRNLAVDMNPGDVPYRPWAKALFEARKDGAHSREDPDAHCLPQGVPKIDSVAYPWKIVRTPNSYLFVYETFTYWRQIFTDGRRVDPNANPTWMGYSTGRWDGDAFVVDTRGFNGKVWLDQLGRPSTDKLHVVERFTRPDFGRLVIDVTIDDPGAYTRPWTVRQEIYLRPDWEPLEFICGENNRDLDKLPGGHTVVTNVEAARALGIRVD